MVEGILLEYLLYFRYRIIPTSSTTTYFYVHAFLDRMTSHIIMSRSLPIESRKMILFHGVLIAIKIAAILLIVNFQLSL